MSPLSDLNTMRTASPKNASEVRTFASDFRTPLAGIPDREGGDGNVAYFYCMFVHLERRMVVRGQRHVVFYPAGDRRALHL